MSDQRDRWYRHHYEGELTRFAAIHEMTNTMLPSDHTLFSAPTNVEASDTEQVPSEG